jgi:hypothetical protein
MLYFYSGKSDRKRGIYNSDIPFDALVAVLLLSMTKKSKKSEGTRFNVETSKTEISFKAVKDRDEAALWVEAIKSCINKETLISGKARLSDYRDASDEEAEEGDEDDEDEDEEESEVRRNNQSKMNE